MQNFSIQKEGCPNVLEHDTNHHGKTNLLLVDADELEIEFC